MTNLKTIEVPDLNFRQYLIETFSATYQGNNSISIIPNDVTTISFSKFSKFSKIKSLEGIEHFSELKTLNIKLLDIKYLDCKNNKKLKNLAIFECLSLKNLKLNDSLQNFFLNKCTNLFNIDLRKSEKLNIVRITNSAIASLDFTACKNLSILQCVRCPNLSYLNLKQVKNTDSFSLVAEDCPKLNYILASEDIFTKDSVRNFVDARIAVVESKQQYDELIKDLPIVKFKDYNFRSNISKYYFTFDRGISIDTTITKFKLGLSPADIGIRTLSESAIEDVGKIESLDGIENFTELETLDISYYKGGNSQKFDLTPFKKLKEFFGTNTRLRSLDFKNNNELEIINCSASPDLTFLNLLNNSNLDSLSCTGCAKLEYIVIPDNPNMEGFDCTSCPELKYIFVKDSNNIPEGWTVDKDEHTEYLNYNHEVVSTYRNFISNHYRWSEKGINFVYNQSGEDIPLHSKVSIDQLIELNEYANENGWTDLCEVMVRFRIVEIVPEDKFIEIALPAEIDLPAEINLPATEINLPATEINLPAAEINLPAAEINLPAEDVVNYYQRLIDESNRKLDKIERENKLRIEMLKRN